MQEGTKTELIRAGHKLAQSTRTANESKTNLLWLKPDNLLVEPLLDCLIKAKCKLILDDGLRS